MSILGTLTQKQIDELRATGHVVYVYSRKLVAVVDGFKRYTVKKGVK